MEARYLQIVLLIATVSILASCKKEEIAVQTWNALEEEPKIMKIAITSSPGENSSYYGMMIFEIEKVEVYIENTGWLELTSKNKKINTYELENGGEMILAESDYKYFELIKKIKLSFGQQNYLNADGSFSGSILELSLEKGYQTIVDVNHQDLKSGHFLLSIDLGHSIEQIDTHFCFKPTICFINHVQTGIKGHVTGTEQAKVMLSNMTVSYCTYLTANGEFFIRGIEDGIYDLVILPVSTNSDVLAKKTIESIKIIKNQITSAQEIKF